MNYNDQILENKAFNFFKQLIYYIVLAVCIILGFCLILVYGFGFRPYNVVSGSMSPVYMIGDMVVVKSQKEYKVGDVVTFNQNSVFDKVTHRIVAIATNSEGEDIYICHGDNTQAANPNSETYVAYWKDDVDYLQQLTDEQLLSQDTSIITNVQLVKLSQIEGTVVTHLDNWGKYFNFIGDHKLLFVAMIIAIWCVSATVQNEMEMKRNLRLL